MFYKVRLAVEPNDGTAIAVSLTLSPSHYMPAAADTAGACTGLLPASIGLNGTDADSVVAANAWASAKLVRKHVCRRWLAACNPPSHIPILT